MFSGSENGIYHFEGFAVDVSKRSLTRDDQTLTLSPKAFDLLRALLESHGEMVTKAALLERVWPNQFVEEGNLTVHISAIRKALGQTGDKVYVRTIPGQGYQFVADVIDDRISVVIDEYSVSRITIDNGEPSQASETFVEGPKILSIEKSRSRLSRGAMFATLSVFAIVVAGYGIYLRSSSSAVERGSKSPRQLTAVGDISNVAFAPDGKSFVYQRYHDGQYSLWFDHTNGGYPAQLQPPGYANYDGLVFSPGGDYVYYSVGGVLSRIPTLGGAAEKLLDGIPAGFSLSKDGGSAIYVTNDSNSGSSLLIANLKTGVRETLATRPLLQRFSNYPALSPDGKVVAVGSITADDPNHYFLSLVSRDGLSISTIKDSPAWEEINKTVWLPNGNGVLFNTVGKESDFHLWLASYPSGDVKCITNDLSRYGRASLSISDDGRSLLAVRDQINSSIYLGYLDRSGQLDQLTTGTIGKLDGSPGLTWAGVGRLVYSSFFDNSYALWSVDVPSGVTRQLTPPGYMDRFPSAPTDGSFIIFQSNRSGSQGIWKILADGSGLHQVELDPNPLSPNVSPDGRWIYYSSGSEASRSIYKASIEGGAGIRLTDAQTDAPRVSPDGKYFACLYWDQKAASAKLAVYSTEGELLRLYDRAVTGNFNNGFFWAEDGSAVYYRDNAKGLWRQDLAGDPAEKLAGMPNQRLYYYASSPDRTRYAIAYGTEYRDVVIINDF